MKESIEYLQKKHDIPNLIVLDLNDEVPYYMNAMDVRKPSRRVQKLGRRTYQQNAYLKFNDEERSGVL